MKKSWIMFTAVCLLFIVGSLVWHELDRPEVPEPAVYNPSWVPEGYIQGSLGLDEAERKSIHYAHPSGQNPILFGQYADPSQITVRANAETVTVQGAEAKLSRNGDSGASLAWQTPEGWYCLLQANLPDADLLRIAESVKKVSP